LLESPRDPPRPHGGRRALARLYYGIPFRARRLARLYAPFIGSGGLAFDIGAHAGNRVRAFRRLGARVVAVEPQPDFVRLLEALYGRDRDVTIVVAAVGRAIGEATLHASERTPTVTTLSPEWATRVGADASFRGVRWTPGARVPVTTLDALVAAHGRPDFVKLDVEGYEAEALAGLSTPVARSPSNTWRRRARSHSTAWTASARSGTTPTTGRRASGSGSPSTRG
jgi:FkbM family methyltransferase